MKRTLMVLLLLGVASAAPVLGQDKRPEPAPEAKRPPRWMLDEKGERVPFKVKVKGSKPEKLEKLDEQVKEKKLAKVIEGQYWVHLSGEIPYGRLKETIDDLIRKYGGEPVVRDERNWVFIVKGLSEQQAKDLSDDPRVEAVSEDAIYKREVITPGPSEGQGFVGDALQSGFPTATWWRDRIDQRDGTDGYYEPLPTPLASPIKIFIQEPDGVSIDHPDFDFSAGRKSAQKFVANINAFEQSLGNPEDLLQAKIACGGHPTGLASIALGQTGVAVGASFVSLRHINCHTQSWHLQDILASYDHIATETAVSPGSVTIQAWDLGPGVLSPVNRALLVGRIDGVINAGGLVVMAAGNATPPTAATTAICNEVPRMLCAGATQRDGANKDYLWVGTQAPMVGMGSVYGPRVDVFAPTAAQTFATTQFMPGPTYNPVIWASGDGGTSHASPMVGAVAWQLWTTYPSAPWSLVKKVITSPKVATMGRIQNLPAGQAANKILYNRFITGALRNAASYGEKVAPDQLVAGFFDRIDPQDVKIAIVDPVTEVEKPAAILYSSTSQVNFHIPPGLNFGFTYAAIDSRWGCNPLTGCGGAGVGLLRLARIAPGVFTFSGGGSGVAAIENWYPTGSGCPSGIQDYGGVCVEKLHPDLPNAAFPQGGRVVQDYSLVIYSTGLRNRNNLSEVTVEIKNPSTGTWVPLTVEYAGLSSCCTGLDQVNARFPSTFPASMRGTLDLRLKVEGETANAVQVYLRP